MRPFWIKNLETRRTSTQRWKRQEDKIAYAALCCCCCYCFYHHLILLLLSWARILFRHTVSVQFWNMHTKSMTKFYPRFDEALEMLHELDRSELNWLNFGLAFLSVYKRERTIRSCMIEKKLSRHIFETMFVVFIASTVDFQYIERWSRCKQASLSLVSYFNPSFLFFSFTYSMHIIWIDAGHKRCMLVFVCVNVLQ